MIYVLLQERESHQFQPIEYWQKTLDNAEEIYYITQKECLAVV